MSSTLEVGFVFCSVGNISCLKQFFLHCFQKAVDVYSKASEAEHMQRDYKKALALYNQANDYLIHVLKYEHVTFFFVVWL